MSETRISEGQIAAALEWWTKALGHPKYDALGARRHDDMREPGYHAERREREPMEMASVMMRVFGAKLTAEQIDTFASHLRDVLSGRCEHTWRGYTGKEYGFSDDLRTLSVDYDPDVVLRHCGEIAGFPVAFFWPIKTMMWLTNGDVRVRYGYGAEIETVYASPSVQPPRSDET